jgi:AcrR family transcriptional regulator
MTTRRTQAARRTESRKRIMEAAERLLAEKGYFGASVEEIVRQAGYSQGAFYRHWASKEQMVLDLIRERARRQAAVVSQAEPSADPGALLQALRVEAGDPRLFFEMWLLSLRGHPVAPFLQQHYRTWREEIAALLQSRGAGDAQEQAALLIALFDGLIVQQALEPEAVPMERLAPSLARLLERLLTEEGRA